MQDCSAFIGLIQAWPPAKAFSSFIRSYVVCSGERIRHGLVHAARGKRGMQLRIHELLRSAHAKASAVCGQRGGNTIQP